MTVIFIIVGILVGITSYFVLRCADKIIYGKFKNYEEKKGKYARTSLIQSVGICLLQIVLSIILYNIMLYCGNIIDSILVTINDYKYLLLIVSIISLTIICISIVIFKKYDKKLNVTKES